MLFSVDVRPTHNLVPTISTVSKHYSYSKMATICFWCCPTISYIFFYSVFIFFIRKCVYNMHVTFIQSLKRAIFYVSNWCSLTLLKLMLRSKNCRWFLMFVFRSKTIYLHIQCRVYISLHLRKEKWFTFLWFFSIRKIENFMAWIFLIA